MSWLAPVNPGIDSCKSDVVTELWSDQTPLYGTIVIID